MKQNINTGLEYRRYIKYSNGGRTEYFQYGVKRKESMNPPQHYFFMAGKGVVDTITATSLERLLYKFEDQVQVERNRRTDEQIEKGTHMTGTHYDSAHERIQREVEDHDKEIKPAEWVREVKP